VLISEQREATLQLTLNRPEKRNALHPNLIHDLTQLLAQTASDEAIKVVVITGAGTSFCAGLDLDHLVSLETEGRVVYMQSAFALFHQLYTQPQPVIAAVNGPAIAGGFDLAAFCDLRLCTPSAIFAQTEVLLGLTQIMYPLYKLIGLGRAKELALTGKAISAQEAYRIGLVNQICPAEELLYQAMKLAEDLSSKPRQALFDTKRLSRELIELDTVSAMNRMLEVITERLRSEEHWRESSEYVARRMRRT
jgi:enoyl-CoA hydratase/carnithine racemase